MQILRRIFAVLAFVLLGLLTSALPGHAHARLESSNPADGATLSVPPERIALKFSEAVDAGFASVAVIGPDGKSHWEEGKPSAAGQRVTAGVRELGAAGEYVVRYRVLSADGHPVSGRLRFILRAAGGGSPAVAGAAPADFAAADGVPLWVWIAGATGLFAVGALAAAFVARGSRSDGK